MENILHFLLADRRRIHGRTANEARHLRRVFDQVPCFVGHLHLDQYIAREKFPFAEIFLSCFHLDDFFHRNEYLPELVQHSSAADSLLQRTLHTLLETGVGMNHIPLLIHHPSCPMRYFTASSRPASIIHRNMAITRTKAKTIPV